MDGAFPTSRSPSPRWEPYGHLMGEERLRERLRRELDEGTPAMRLRAAARLVEGLGSEAAAAVEAALSAAEDPELKAALIERLAAAGSPRSFPVIRQHLHDSSPEVRAAAAAAAARLASDDAERDEAISLALADGDARVRRRALIAATCLRGIDAGPWVAGLTADEDRHCRRLACIALGSTRDPAAALALVDALRDEDEGVRQAAESAARRLFGERVAEITRLSGWERGRAIARLRAWVASQPPSAWETGVEVVAEEEAPREAARTVSPEEDGAETAEAEMEGDGAPAPRGAELHREAEEREAETVAEADGASDERDRWTEQIEQTLRTALRGATLAELVDVTQTTEALLSPWIETLVSQGKIVRRGRKYYFP